MSTLYRLATGCALLGLLAGTVGFLGTGLLARLGIEGWDLPGSLDMLEEAREREETLATKVELAKARRATLDRVARDLLAGRLTLSQAAGRFRDLLADCEALWAHLAEEVPGRTEEERLCRYVIGWATSLLDRDREAVVRASLEAELESRLSREGVLAPRGCGAHQPKKGGS